VRNLTPAQALSLAASNLAGRVLPAGTGGIVEKEAGGVERRLAQEAEKEAAGRALGGVVKPTVSERKLQNLISDLYKGEGAAGQIGTGSTADAIRNELATGLPTKGRFHSTKGRQYVTALERWLTNNPSASAADRTAARQVLDDLRLALGGS
jgi:hypothetical protein